MKVTKEKLKQIIKEELGRMDEADEEVDLAGLIDDLGSLDLVKQVLQGVARDVPEFAASFKSYYDYFMSE